MAAPLASFGPYDHGETTNHGALSDDVASLERSVLAGEIAACRALTFVCVAAIGMVLLIAPSIGAELATAQVVLCSIAVVHFMLMRHGLEHLGAVRPRRHGALEAMRWCGATLEVSFATFALLVALRLQGPAWAATSPVSSVYALAMIAASFRLRPAISIYAAGLAAVQSLLVYYLAIAPHLDAEQTEALPTLQAWAAWERAFWLLLVGVLLAVASKRLRALALANTAGERLRRAAVVELERMVSPDVASRALAGGLVPGHSERRHVTVLFCDLRDFTALCERRRAEDALSVLNAFYERACFIVQAHGGHVNKFLGDGLLALFGAPEHHPSHARAAVECARQLAKAATDLRAEGGVWSELAIGIGLDTGDVVLGAVGSSDRLEYTAIGSTVNRAARLQALSSTTARNIVISARTASELGNDAASLLPLGEAKIKGVDRPVRIYTPR